MARGAVLATLLSIRLILALDPAAALSPREHELSEGAAPAAQRAEVDWPRERGEAAEAAQLETEDERAVVTPQGLALDDPDPSQEGGRGALRRGNCGAAAEEVET